MSMDGAPPGHRGNAARVLTIDLEELTWALSPREQARKGLLGWRRPSRDFTRRG
ncbi:MAG: hypothetical protein KA169_12635 [Burkholderiaceae bacterium]|jgi:hypothetical protein|nr:hypothetical protein [Burkholderiaceae bacterium]